MTGNNLSLQPTSRVDFISLFTMPGYEVESIVGTTYCLNCETLLMLILGIVYGPGADQAMEHTSGEINPGAIFAAIERVKGKLKVYCQIDKADMGLTGTEKSREIQTIKSLLDEFIVPVSMKKEGRSFSSFHPKIWQICFKNGEKRKVRFAVMSRNLTSNRDFDSAAIFEEYIKNPPGLHLNTDLFNENSFPVKGVKISAAALQNCHSVISPFLDAELLKAGFPELNIFSLRQEIDKVWKASPALLKKYHFFCVNPALETIAEGRHSAIHAKVYLGNDSMILGSSNFTYRGWNLNREFNVKIDHGIEQNELLKQLTKDCGGIFVPYTPPAEGTEISDDPKETLLQELACLSLEADWDGESLSLHILNPFHIDLNEFQWKPLRGDQVWKKGKNLSWILNEKDVCRIFLCRVRNQEIPMLAVLSGNLESLWKKRFAEAKKILTLAEELEYRILMSESAQEIYGKDVPLKRNNDSGSGSAQTPPRPPIFERLLKMNQNELEQFFKYDLSVRDDDPLGLVQAFYELKAFFGFKTENAK